MSKFDCNSNYSDIIARNGQMTIQRFFENLAINAKINVCDKYFF